MIKTYYLSTCVPTHKVIQNKNKYIAHNRGMFETQKVHRHDKFMKEWSQH